MAVYSECFVRNFAGVLRSKTLSCLSVQFRMRCLYEILQVRRDAEASTVKKSYRSLALLLHPDKNPGNPTAYERFQELQRAYDILSDPQERAWYDRQRGTVLQTDLQSRTTVHPDSTSPFPDLVLQEHQSPSAFSAFDDSSTGFYTVFSKLFKSLHSQEEQASAASDAAAHAPAEAAPPFGSSKAALNDVKKFYSYWSSFQTVKDFAWLDLHDPQSGTGRHMKRLLETENSKARKAGKVAFVKEVRQLVDWVKTEDIRVQQAWELEQRKRTDDEAARQARAECARKCRQAAGARYEDPEWIKVSEKEQLEALEVEQQQAAEQAAAQVFECVVCDKVFKTERAQRRHEAGTNHKHQVKMLKLQLLAEDSLAVDG